MIERKGHPWFLGCQFYPEYKSPPLGAPPAVSLISSRAARGHKANKTAVQVALPADVSEV